MHTADVGGIFKDSFPDSVGFWKFRYDINRHTGHFKFTVGTNRPQQGADGWSGGCMDRSQVYMGMVMGRTRMHFACRMGRTHA